MKCLFWPEASEVTDWKRPQLENKRATLRAVRREPPSVKIDCNFLLYKNPWCFMSLPTVTLWHVLFTISLTKKAWKQLNQAIIKISSWPSDPRDLSEQIPKLLWYATCQTTQYNQQQNILILTAGATISTTAFILTKQYLMFDFLECLPFYTDTEWIRTALIR